MYEVSASRQAEDISSIRRQLWQAPALSHHQAGHVCCHDASNLRRHPVILVRGHEIELEVPDVGAIHHVELAGREGIRICPVMRSVLSKTFSAQVHDMLSCST